LNYYTAASPSDGNRRLSTEVEFARPSSVGEEEIQLQLALAMSKEEHEDQVRKQKTDDIKLQLAIDESKKVAKDEVGNINRYFFMGLFQFSLLLLVL